MIDFNCGRFILVKILDKLKTMDEDFDLTHIESKATEYVHLAKLADEESRLESALIYYKVIIINPVK